MDDRQRLVRGNSFPVANGATRGNRSDSMRRPAAPAGQGTEMLDVAAAGAPASGTRVYGGGIQADGVFSNLSARPERAESEKDEQPPVCVT